MSLTNTLRYCLYRHTFNNLLISSFLHFNHRGHVPRDLIISKTDCLQPPSKTLIHFAPKHPRTNVEIRL